MRLALALLLALLAAPDARAQDYPTRNLTFDVPTGPGAGTDLLARILAPRLANGSASRWWWRIVRAPAR